MARMKEETELLTRQLIVKITGFEERDENFTLCSQFAHFNFCFHRFLDVDSHRVTRQVEGLCIKFRVHALEKRADAFKDLVDHFLQAPILEGQEAVRTDTHFALLSVLCLLADSPTNTHYQPRPVVAAVEEPQDRFNWAAHLLDGENNFFDFHSDTSSEAADDLLQDSDDSSDQNKEVQIASCAEEDKKQSLPAAPPGTSTSVNTTLEQEQAEEWLNQNIMVQYWKGQSQNEIRGRHASSNLLRDWNSYQVRSGEVYAMVGQHIVTEYQLIREILWMLSGVDDLFLFHKTAAGFRLKENVRLSHLTGESLESCLSQVTSLAGRLHHLQAFVEGVVGACCYPTDSVRPAFNSQTYQAFADTLARVLRDFRACLSDLERKAAKQEVSDGVTVSSLLHKLAPWRPILDAVWDVFTAGVLSVTQPAGVNQELNNSARVSCLLTALYDAVITQDSLGQSTTSLVSLLLRLLLETSRPYLDIIGQWISVGQLSDPAREFVLQRNEGIQCLDETFWERAFTLNSSGPAHKSISNTSLSSAGLCAEEEELEQAVEDIVEATPKFLRPVMRYVMLTGKSMELLQALGRLPEVLASVGDGLFRDKSLYQLLVDSLKEVLGTVPLQTTDIQEETTLMTQVFIQNVHMENHVTGEQDHLLRINFENIFSTVLKKKQADPYDLSCLGSFEEKCLNPINMLFQQCLYPHIHRRYEHVCSRLLEILKKEYKLMDFLSAMQHFYLMSAGDAMFDFYTQIFDKMRHQEMWRDPSSLTLALQEALQSQHAVYANRLSISFEMTTSRERSAVGVTDCLRLNFAVPWPVDVVVSSKTQNLYNKVFCFLLQIKRAKYGLDQLRFTELDKPPLLTVSIDNSLTRSGMAEKIPRSDRLHRLHILRFRLTYFVNSLHNYIMTRILHSTGLEFADEIKEAMDLEQVIDVHARYVQTIHERCLLHKKLAFLKDAVTKVLNLTLAFAMRWDQGVHNISGQTLTEMEVEFSRTIQFLASFLNNIIKRGSFPHVEPLAFALVTSLPSSKMF